MQKWPRKSFVKKITDRNFEERVIHGSGKILLVVGALWCSDTIHFLRTILPGYARKYHKSVSFFVSEIEGFEIGVKLNPRMGDSLQIVRYPTIVIFWDGHWIAQRISEESKGPGTQAKDMCDMLQMLEIL